MGAGAFACGCGQVLIQGYDSARFLSVGIACGRCGALSVTPGLPDGQAPPFAVVIAEPIAEPRTQTITLPPSAFVAGRAEMSRITALYQPVTPAGNVYRMTPEVLDGLAEAYGRHVGAALPVGAGPAEDPFAGMAEDALGWAVGHLRERMRNPDWACLEDTATAAASCHAAGFLHFLASWSHHPLFSAMLATAAERGFSLHGLAPFAAAHCLTMQGNTVGFPGATAERIEGISLATGPTETLAVLLEVFDRFEYPHGQPWDAARLRAAVQEVLGAAASRLNLRNPGVLVLSPGLALAGFDEALIAAVQAGVQAVGRRHRGLMAVAPVVLRLLPAAGDKQAVQFGYGFFPVLNRHYRGKVPVTSQLGGSSG